MNADVVVVAGARPNFVKVKPVLDGLGERNIKTCFVNTGQHYDDRMSRVFFEDLGIRDPDFSLDVGSGTHAEQTAAVMTRFEPLLAMTKAQAVVVFGDINSTVACALVGAKSGAYVVHVEAGLRSRDWSMPEEINRVVTDRLSDLLLAPSEDAVQNLASEGCNPDCVRLVGNVMIDTLMANIDRARERQVCASLGLKEKGFVLMTLHRPSNVDDPNGLENLLTGVKHLAADSPVVFPVHPRTKQRLAEIPIPPGLQLIEPLGYLDFLSLQASAGVVITDSGGVQEETTALGVPCITARDTTERPITISEGTNQLAGTHPSRIVELARAALSHPPAPRCPQLWDGKAGERCARAIHDLLNSPRWPRPSDSFGSDNPNLHS